MRRLGQREDLEAFHTGERERFIKPLEAPQSLSKLRIMVKLMLATGLHRDELFYLDWDRVDPLNLTLRVAAKTPKTRKERKVDLSDGIITVLEE